MFNYICHGLGGRPCIFVVIEMIFFFYNNHCVLLPSYTSLQQSEKKDTGFWIHRVTFLEVLHNFHVPMSPLFLCQAVPSLAAALRTSDYTFYYITDSASSQKRGFGAFPRCQREEMSLLISLSSTAQGTEEKLESSGKQSSLEKSRN